MRALVTNGGDTGNIKLDRPLGEQVNVDPILCRPDTFQTTRAAPTSDQLVTSTYLTYLFLCKGGYAFPDMRFAHLSDSPQGPAGAQVTMKRIKHQ